MPRRARELPARYGSAERVLVDSSVLIDVLARDPQWCEWSMARLEPLLAARAAVIDPIVYAEIAAGYADIETLEDALRPLGLVREALPWEAAFLAAQAFKLYRSRGGGKRSPLPDFYIGAHASIAGYRLLTRACARYREYFPKTQLIAPD
jgi:hypothetical protein